MSGPRESITRTCISLRLTQLATLRDLSRDTGAPVAELTRRAVDAFLVGRVAGYVPGWQNPAPEPCEAGPAAVTTHT